ncbi:MAG: response regulator [Rhodocyclaceae bacterium]|nr:response regulator [Rhodocyclaceae bacterium]MBX3669136.1 response regulator [Rhodocyclaceae bacterium]
MLKKILIVDDDPELRQLLSNYLVRQGYDALQAPDASNIEAMLTRHSPHLLVLDLMLPKEDGLAVCRRLRGRGEDIPIIMLTARDDTIDRIVGLEMGADDYVGKPFDPRELVARIEAVLRRRGAPPAVPVAGAEVICFGPAEDPRKFDLAARTLKVGGSTVALTSGEFALLHVLVKNANRPQKRERLLELTHENDAETFDRAIDVQVHRLRKLIEPDPAQPRYLQTVRGLGYVFVPDGNLRTERGT